MVNINLITGVFNVSADFFPVEIKLYAMDILNHKVNHPNTTVEEYRNLFLHKRPDTFNFGHASVIDDAIISAHTHREYWAAAFDNPSEDEHITNRGRNLIAYDVGIFTINIKER